MAAATTRLRVRVAPGAARSEVVGRFGDSWKVRVGAALHGLSPRDVAARMGEPA